MDSLLTGISFRIQNIKFSYIYFIKFFVDTFFTMMICHFIFQMFSISLFHPMIKFFIFFILGILSFTSKETKISKTFYQKEYYFFIIGNSLDGFIISLTFPCSFWYLSFLFSFVGTLFFLIGNQIPLKKRKNWMSSFLFFLLAILSLLQTF